MSPRVVRHEALMRLRNTETVRRSLWRRLDRGVQCGRFTQREADQLKRGFWDSRLRDLRIVRALHR